MPGYSLLKVLLKMVPGDLANTVRVFSTALCLVLVAACGDAGSGSLDAGASDAGGQDALPDVGPAPPTWCSTQWPLATATTAGVATESLYVRTRVQGVTPSGGADPSLRVDVGFGPSTATPSESSWAWQPASHNPLCATCTNEDELVGTVTPEQAGDLLWGARVRYEDGPWVYCDRSDGGRLGSDDGWSADDAPLLTVSAASSVTIVTLNLRCLIDDWDARLPLIADAIADADPDVVGLQEVCAEPGGRDNLEELLSALGARTGLSYDSARTVTHWSWDTYDEGIALVSPHSITDEEAISLPPGAFQRKALMARLVTAQDPVVVATTHLDHLNSDIREQQIAAAVEGIAEFASAAEGRILVGDLNEGPSGNVHSSLEASGYADLWDALHPGEDGYTFPASGPNVRIDYVWLYAGQSGLGPESITRILDTAVGGVTGSDHLGLAATVSR